MHLPVGTERVAVDELRYHLVHKPLSMLPYQNGSGRQVETDESRASRRLPC
jgi:hypothetical protein